MRNRRAFDGSTSYASMDDEELVRLAKKELPYQMRAYEELMQRHENLLYAVSLRLLGSRPDAEDAVQDVMLKTFVSIKSFAGKSKFKTWIVRITKNTCVDRLRKKTVADQYAASLINETDVYTEEEHDENRTLELLKHMSVPNREVLTLRYIADFSIQEIADISGLSLSATKMRLYRATDKLRELASAESGESSFPRES